MNIKRKLETVDEISQGKNSRTNSNKDVLNLMCNLPAFKILLLVMIIFTTHTVANAIPAETDAKFCDWVADAALAVAQNKKNGMSEVSLIEKVLEENINYTDQVILIRIIDRVYKTKYDKSPFEHALYEYEACSALLTSLSTGN